MLSVEITAIIHFRKIFHEVNGLNLYPPSKDNDAVPYQVFNIAGDEVVSLLALVEQIESSLGKKAVKQFISDYTGEMLTTHADITALKRLSFAPKVSFCQGCEFFVNWYMQFKNAQF